MSSASNSNKGSKKGGRKEGVVNYKKPIVIESVNYHKPVGALQWKRTVDTYQYKSGEAILREPSHFKAYWVQTCCNNMKKPTGDSGANSSIAQCQAIQRKMLKKEEAMPVGGLSSDSEDDSDDYGESYLAEEEEVQQEDFEVRTILELEQQRAPPDASTLAAQTQEMPAPVGAGPTTSRKRLHPDEDNGDSHKSKNSRPSGSSKRSSAAAAISGLVNVIGANSANNQTMQMMQMLMQQQQFMFQMMQTRGVATPPVASSSSSSMSSLTRQDTPYPDTSAMFDAFSLEN